MTYFITVSYTHLDVYKRQVYSTGPRPNSPGEENNFNIDSGSVSFRRNLLTVTIISPVCKLLNATLIYDQDISGLSVSLLV